MAWRSSKLFFKKVNLAAGPVVCCSQKVVTGHVGGFVSNVRVYVPLEVMAVTLMERTQGKGDLKVER